MAEENPSRLKNESSHVSHSEKNQQQVASSNGSDGDSPLLQQMRDELEKWKNDYLYLRAEFDNYRKHVIKERTDLTKYGAEKFLHDFLEIVDMMERALSVHPSAENLSSYVQGVQMIVKEIKNLLQKHGVVEESCLHQPFDPSRHEAVGSEPSTEISPGHIVKIVKKPYRYHERLLRPGQVLVAVETKNQ